MIYFHGNSMLIPYGNSHIDAGFLRKHQLEPSLDPLDPASKNCRKFSDQNAMEEL